MRRQQIIKAALEIFSRKGFAMATTAEIAREAGVAEGTIYNYFESKRDLFIAVIRDFVITIPLLDLIDRMPKENIAASLKLILQNRMQLVESGLVSRIPVMMADVMRDPELKAHWAEEFLQPFLEKMEGIYRALRDSGIYRDIEPSVAVRCVGGMIFGFLMFKMLEGDSSPLNRLLPEKVSDGFVGLLLHGLLDERDDNTV